jgi:hypothetical protein
LSVTVTPNVNHVTFGSFAQQFLSPRTGYRGYTDLVPGATSQSASAHECRQCCAFCDRLVHPSGCIESRCPYLYLFDDERTGRRFMGCMNKVFRGEIDVAVFEEAQRTRHGFGGVKMTGTPISRCKFSVEKAYDGHGDAFDCVNPQFFAEPDADAFAFDLRDRL